MSEAENAEFEEAAGYLLDELGYETVTPRDEWLPPEEWARSKSAPTAGVAEPWACCRDCAAWGQGASRRYSSSA